MGLEKHLALVRELGKGLPDRGSNKEKGWEANFGETVG